MDSKKNILIGAVVLAAAAGIVWILARDAGDVDNPTPSASASPSPSASKTPVRTPSPTPTPSPALLTVHLTASGPSPKTLTIRAGDAVTFVNDTDVLYWPASDPFPTNDRCPGFDARRGLARGESYTLVFSTARTCTYHDNLDPYDQSSHGTVIVQ